MDGSSSLLNCSVGIYCSCMACMYCMCVSLCIYFYCKDDGLGWFWDRLHLLLAVLYSICHSVAFSLASF